MARPRRMNRVSGNSLSTLAASAAIYGRKQNTQKQDERRTIAKPWQIEMYRHVNICGEARYAVSLYASLASRAELGISEAQTLRGKAKWVNEGPEVDALAELAPTVRERTKLIRDYMLHRVIAGECYLIARQRRSNDPGYIAPPNGFETWDDYIQQETQRIDVLQTGEQRPKRPENPNDPVWEIVAVTELRKTGTGSSEVWQVRYDNEHWVALDDEDPIIRFWSPDPENRREAWSPMRSMETTLREIEWLTGHIFRQVRSRLMSAGVWFLPDNLTFPKPPSTSVEGGDEEIATYNEAEQFMLTLAAAGTYELDMNDVSFPTVVLTNAEALKHVDQEKLIKFWSDIDDKAMILRSANIQRFALGMDLPPEQVLGSSGIAVTGGGSSAGSVNHWGVWANEEQTISSHIEPALDDFVGTLTSGYLRLAVDQTKLVVAYDTASLRLRQDRSKEAIELHDRGLLKGDVTLREVGFDPDNDKMDETEFRRWLLTRIAGGSATPEQVTESLRLLGVILNVPEQGVSETAPGQPGRNSPPSLEDHPYEGPPRVDHEHNPAPFSAFQASCEGLVLRALEKAGNRLLNDRTRGKDKDRATPPHLAYVVASAIPDIQPEDFDFSLAAMTLAGLSAAEQDIAVRRLGLFCYSLYKNQEPYSREALTHVLKGF